MVRPRATAVPLPGEEPDVTPWVQRLLIANIAAFFVQLTVPRLVEPLVFVPMLVFMQPWTIVTYMFLHGGFTHLLFNMLGLYFFGPRIESRLGSRRFITLYFVAGVSGALLSFIFAPYAGVIGASAGVFGIMLAFAHFWPREQIFIWGVLPLEARWLVVITTALALWSGFSGSRGGVADFAHLGGYAGAYVYLRLIRWGSAAARFKRKAEGGGAIVGSIAPSVGGWQRIDPSKVHEVNRDEVNRILDKISAQGIGSLTPQERVFLMHFVPPDDRKPM
ncbi:MAG: rhomboid family intramembrane serine protease [Verrucomicrobia bacterium]|nr:rhomboid family intramembrane serine protease [Verrucomicrobiota bacterium]